MKLKERLLKQTKKIEYVYNMDQKALTYLKDIVETNDYEDEASFDSCVNEYVKSEMVSYKEAFDYLYESNNNDIKEAYNLGLTDICDIAQYYLEEKILNYKSQYLRFN